MSSPNYGDLTEDFKKLFGHDDYGLHTKNVRIDEFSKRTRDYLEKKGTIKVNENLKVGTKLKFLIPFEWVEYNGITYKNGQQVIFTGYNKCEHISGCTNKTCCGRMKLQGFNFPVCCSWFGMRGFIKVKRNKKVRLMRMIRIDWGE